MQKLEVKSKSRNLISSSTRSITVVAVMTGLCVATNYALVGVPNVKFMDLIVFTTGFIFGWASGLSVGVLTWMVYGTLNPYGFSLPILIATSLGEAIYGIVGGFVGKFDSKNLVEDKNDKGKYFIFGLKLAILGVLLTATYDFFTNIVVALTLDPYNPPFIPVFINGAPFAIVHTISNVTFFFVGGPVLVTAIKRFLSWR